MTIFVISSTHIAVRHLPRCRHRRGPKPFGVHRRPAQGKINATGLQILESFGLTELFSESREPPFWESPLGQTKVL
ncbi:MAG TPA: hypothetical protein VFI46_17125, partial [Jiangellaceae bacterium]|nr:hypothetical protein [Jiangellaceae bacterium]